MAKPQKNTAPTVQKPKVGYQSVGVKKSELPSNPPPVGMQYVQQSDNTYKLFAKPPAPIGVKPATAPTVAKGVFTNKSTGKYTNAQGQEVDAQGNVIKAPVVDPTKTYAERAKGVQAGEVASTAEYGKELGFDTLPSTMEEAIQRYKDSQAADLKYTQDQQRLAEQSEASQFEKSMRDIGASVAGTTAALAQGREGAVGSSAPQAIRQYQVEADRQTRQLQAEQQSAQLARTETLRKIQEATAANDENLVRAYQGQLSSIENDLRRLDTEAQNAATQALEMSISSEDLLLRKEANQRNNLESFTTLVDQGVELGTEGIMSFAKSLNIPFESAFSYYQGAQKVRDDKTLSLEEKQIKNQQLTQDLQDTISGQNIAEVKKLTIIENLYKSGATQEEISRAKDAFGLTDDQDPVYQLDLEIKRAEAKMKAAEANGEIISPIDQLDYAAKVAELMAATGGTGSYNPTNSKYEVTATANGIVVNVPVDDKGRPVSGRGQCGEFVNDVLGIGVGDSLQSKSKFIDKSIVVPSAGMAFVTSRGYDLGGGVNSGHIGIVESVNPDGTFNTVEANYNGDEKITRRRNVPITEVVGFIRPPKSEFVSGAGADAAEYSYDSYLKEAGVMGLPPKEAEEWAKDMVKQAYSGFRTVDQSNAYNAYNKMKFESDQYKATTKGLTDDQLTEYVDGVGVIAKKITDTESPLTSQVINEYIDDPKVRALIQMEARWIGSKLRKESGAAITVGEYLSEGSQFWPRKGDDPAQIKIKEQARDNIEKGLYEVMGPYGQRVYGGQAQTEAIQQPKMNPLLQFVIDKMDASNLDDLYSQAANLPSDTSEFDAVWGSPLTPSN